MGSDPITQLLSQQHINRAAPAVCARRIRVGEYRRMAPEKLSHARLQDGDILLGVQASAVDDADTSMTEAPALDELFHARDRFRGRLAVEIERAGGRIVSALQFSELAPIDTGCDVALILSDAVVAVIAC
jgi:hypothetical protein